jgi:hypothetical protein
MNATRKKMELIEVIAKSHFEDTRIGAVSRKQRLRIPKELAEFLVNLDLVDYINPPLALVKQTPQIEATESGGDEPQSWSQPEQVSQSETVQAPKRGRRRKTGEY